MMINLAKNYPHYGWHNNKGYGTVEHQAGLAQHGISPHHRCRFVRLRALLLQHKNLSRTPPQDMVLRINFSA